jgi:hypothetical protein
MQLDEEGGAWGHILHELRHRLDDLSTHEHGVSRDIAEIQNDIRDLKLHQRGQLTTEQVVAVTLLLLMKDRQKWLWGRSRVYIGTTVAVIAGIFVFKSWIAGFLSFLASLFKGG